MILTQIVQLMPFILLVTITVCAFLYVLVQVDKNPEREAHRWLNRHPRNLLVVAGIIFVVVSLLVITLATDIL